MKEEPMSGENYSTLPIELETERSQQTPNLRATSHRAEAVLPEPYFRGPQCTKANLNMYAPDLIYLVRHY